MNKARIKKLELKVKGKDKQEIEVLWTGEKPKRPPKPGERVIKIKWPGSEG